MKVCSLLSKSVKPMDLVKNEMQILQFDMSEDDKKKDRIKTQEIFEDKGFNAMDQVYLLKKIKADYGKKVQKAKGKK